MDTTNQIVDNGKTAAIVSYLTLIGWLISYFALYKDNKTALAAYHLRQSLLLMLAAIALQIARVILYIIFPYSFWFILSLGFGVLFIGLFVFWILGFIAALNGEEKPMPIIGPMAQNIFKGI